MAQHGLEIHVVEYSYRVKMDRNQLRNDYLEQHHGQIVIVMPYIRLTTKNHGYRILKNLQNGGLEIIRFGVG